MKINNKDLTIEETIDFVKKYKKDIETNKLSRQYLLTRLIPKNCNVLDFGCGWGTLSKMIEERGNTVVGIDQSENDIEICKTVWGDTKNLKFENKEIFDIDSLSFDCVISTQVIEHVHNVGNYLNHCNRVLKKNGYLVISLPNIVNPKIFFEQLYPRKYFIRKLFERSKNININYSKVHDHINGWDQYHFVTMVSSIGFELKYYKAMEGVPLPRINKILPKFIVNKYLFNLLQNFCYTMAFVFIKVRNSNIKNMD